ncbi:MAG: 1-acyl-sn-glycerol-3-phosphate acyltransferase, partial [Okeania sp. SIO2H7]|nr:1-acyl-sn-glycerol-3-phosphate acyltransferase [Okeania sp. SIO2H7]
MLFDIPLQLSHGLLTVAGTQVSVRYRERIPKAGPLLIVSNHRSFLDAPLLMAALDRSVRFACHHYMSQVPVLKDMVNALGCFPLDAPGQRRQVFFQKATSILQSQQPVGIFPEGANPMVRSTQPHELGRFHRGFAHLALRMPIESLAILPVAIS